MFGSCAADDPYRHFLRDDENESGNDRRETPLGDLTAGFQPAVFLRFVRRVVQRQLEPVTISNWRNHP